MTHRPAVILARGDGFFESLVHLVTGILEGRVVYEHTRFTGKREVCWHFKTFGVNQYNNSTLFCVMYKYLLFLIMDM